MKFIYAEKTEKTEKTPTFGDVKYNQFFVDNAGYLCQKTANSSFAVIAHPDGTPYSIWFDNALSTKEIKRILPKVVKIEF